MSDNLFKMRLIRVLMILLTGLAVWGVGNISYVHWLGESACPMLGPVPACYVILIAYSLILLSLLRMTRFSRTLFLLGWVPVFVLAMIGIVGELTGTLSCPASAIGIPKCYFSALLSAGIGVLYWRLMRLRAQSK